MNRWTLLPWALGLAACMGSDPLDSDDPSPAAPDIQLDDGATSHHQGDGADGTENPDSGGTAAHEDCTQVAPETLVAESLGDGEAEIRHEGVDLPSCGWEARTTVDTAAQQLAISYVADGDEEACAELCDTNVVFTATGLSTGTWTVLAGLSETTLQVP